MLDRLKLCFGARSCNLASLVFYLSIWDYHVNHLGAKRNYYNYYLYSLPWATTSNCVRSAVIGFNFWTKIAALADLYIRPQRQLYLTL